MNRKAPFATVIALALLPILMAPAQGREKTLKQPVAISLPADGPVERLEAQPRLPIEVVPLSGSVPAPGLSQERHQRDGVADPTTAHACDGTKISPSQCAQLAARIRRFMSEKPPPVVPRAAAPQVCGKGQQPTATCAAIVAQIANWLKTRQTTDAVPPPPALAGDPASDR